MVDIEEDGEWSYVDKIEDEDQSSNPVVGEDALDRMAIALGGRAMLQCIMTTLPQMLQSGKCREGATAWNGAMIAPTNSEVEYVSWLCIQMS